MMKQLQIEHMHAGTRGVARFAALLGMIACAASVVWAQGSVNKSALTRAMTDELARSKNFLRMQGAERLYYLDYSVADLTIWEAEATFGGLRYAGQERARTLRTMLRVGDYAFDNTSFVGADIQGVFNTIRGERIALDDDYDAIRQALWLSTDRAFKNAAESFSKKQAAQQNRTQDQAVPSFARVEKPAAPVSATALPRWDTGRWQNACVTLSQIFKRYPAIRECSVKFRLAQGGTTFMNSEGAQQEIPCSHATVLVTANALADDGMPIADQICLMGREETDLPAPAELAKQVEALAQRLIARRSAAVLDGYTGPALFEGQAAGELFRQLLANNLSAHNRLGFEVKMFENVFQVAESAFKAKVGGRVLPESFDAVDDPTQTQADGHALLGSYTVDNESVTAQRVSLVEKGILKGFLTSRTPVKGFVLSNGHGRTLFRGAPTARVGNLLISDRQARPMEALRQQMMELCKAQGRDFGVIIRALESQEGKAEETTITFMGGGATGGVKSALYAPIEAYKVFADGHSEPLRSVEFANANPSLLRSILGGSTARYIHHYLDSTGSLRALNGIREGVPASLVAPAVLVEEVELKKSSAEPEKAPLIAHPLAR